MIPHPTPRRRAHAFTLIEVLLAVAVFAIVLAAINSVFFGALRLRNKTSQAFENALPLQHAVAIIKRDLEGIMLPGGTMSGQFQSAPTNFNTATVPVGTRVSPDIFTSSGLIDDVSPWAEVQKVAYYLSDPTNNALGKDLIRSISRNPLPVTAADQPEQQWLMSGIEAMALQYYDGRTWTETWDSSLTTNLPMAIKVQIALFSETGQRAGSAPVEIIFPIMVQPRTNTTTASGGGS
jgi:general secretion pathway protein J